MLLRASPPAAERGMFLGKARQWARQRRGPGAERLGPLNQHGDASLLWEGGGGGGEELERC